ncbi:unnamed protein product [Urochloa decumbens]|uniref:DUF1618 domain-containing protein n=1 Tax=Urochloa decumbens TaxID=240449 RepID=A0ABC9CZL4_9POAL
MGDTDHPSLHPPCHGYKDAEASPEDTSWVLLDLNAYIADRENSTTADAAMSNGKTIRVTLCAAPTPLVSYICVWCPGLQATEMLAMRPSIEAAESDLLLLRVIVRNKANFFVYKTNGGRNRGPSLRPIQIPRPCRARPYTIALLGHRDVTVLPSHGEDAAGIGSFRSHGVGAGSSLVSLHSHAEGAASGLIPYLDGQVIRFRPRVDDAGHYYVASLSFDSCRLQHTSPVSLHGDVPSHITTKVIVLRQDGLVGFVDLLRGIVICDVLCHDKPRYLPLPMEAIRSEDFESDPLLFRDVAVVWGRLTLVELRYIVLPGTNLSRRWTWEVSTWSRKVTPDWKDDWRPGYRIQSGDIKVDEGTENVASLLPKVEDGEGNQRPTLEKLYTACPVLSLSDRHVVYVMGKVGRREDKVLVLSIDMMKRRLDGVATFDAERMVGTMFSYTCMQSRIPDYLNPVRLDSFCTDTLAICCMKRPGNFNVRYPHKLPDRIDEEYAAQYAAPCGDLPCPLSGGVEEQQDTGASKGA